MKEASVAVNAPLRRQCFGSTFGLACSINSFYEIYLTVHDFIHCIGQRRSSVIE